MSAPSSKPSAEPPRSRPLSSDRARALLLAGATALVVIVASSGILDPGDPAAPSGPVSTSPPPAVATDRLVSGTVPAACAADARGATFADGALDARVAALRTWAAAHRGEEATLVVTDAVLTDSGRAALARPDAPPFRDVAVAITADGFRVTGNAFAGPFRFPVRVVLTPEVSGGAVRVVVREIDAGALPGPLRSRIGELVAQAADPAAWQLPLRVDAVVLRGGCAVVRGTARP